MRKLNPMRVLGTGTALAVFLAMGPATAQGTVILSDSFNRTLGNADAGSPPLVSDWGANDNALGGTGSATYTVSNPIGDFDVELVNGDRGEIAFGRTILPVNLATTDAINAGGLKISVDLSPSDIGLSNFNGRDWLGMLLADTAQPSSLGGSGAFFGGNPDSRVGVAMRNSGTMLSRALGGTGFIGGGNPNSLTEPIVDATAYNGYVAWFNGGDGTPGGDPVEEFVSPAVYNVEMFVLESAAGNLFADGATNLVEVYVGIDGGVKTRIDLKPSTPALEDTFVWGDNVQSAGGSDPGDAGRDAYLAFVANANGGHLFDNLVVETVPEPASLALVGMGGLMMLRRTRN